MALAFTDMGAPWVKEPWTSFVYHRRVFILQTYMQAASVFVLYLVFNDLTQPINSPASGEIDLLYQGEDCLAYNKNKTAHNIAGPNCTTTCLFDMSKTSEPIALQSALVGAWVMCTLAFIMSAIRASKHMTGKHVYVAPVLAGAITHRAAEGRPSRYYTTLLAFINLLAIIYVASIWNGIDTLEDKQPDSMCFTNPDATDLHKHINSFHLLWALVFTIDFVVTAYDLVMRYQHKAELVEVSLPEMPRQGAGAAWTPLGERVAAYNVGAWVDAGKGVLKDGNPISGRVTSMGGGMVTVNTAAPTYRFNRYKIGCK